MRFHDSARVLDNAVGSGWQFFMTKKEKIYEMQVL
jgi:hypothetical protein